MPITRVGDQISQNGRGIGDLEVIAIQNDFLLSYSVDDFDNSVEFRRYDADGDPLGGASIQLELENPVDAHTAPLPGGGYAVVWNNTDGTIRLDRVTDTGTVTISVPLPRMESAFDPEVIVLINGNMLVSWRGPFGGELYAQTVSASGALGPLLNVDSANSIFHGSPVATALSTGGFAFAWTVTINNIAEIHARVFLPNGNPIGMEFRVNNLSDPSDRVDNDLPAITALSGGRFVITWEKESEIYARIYRSDGVAASNEIRVGLADTYGTDPDIAELKDGRIVVVWRAEIGEEHGIRARLLSSTGQVIGPEYDIVVASSFNFYHSPKVAALANGDLVVSWLDGDYDPYVLTQVFDPGLPPPVGTPRNDRLVGSNDVDVLQGYAGNDVLIGLGGNDVLNGGIGVDTMIGGRGNDVYVVDNAADRVDERGANGADTVQSSVNFNLNVSARVSGLVENLTLLGAATTGIGNGVANSIVGNARNNMLTGGAGNDTLLGGIGNDTLLGGIGNDTLKGDAGADKLVGGAGRDVMIGGLNTDTFVFSAPLVAANADIVQDFRSVDDRIELENGLMPGLGARIGALAPTAFIANAAGRAADAGDRIVYNTSTGQLFYDADGSGVKAAVLLATFAGKPLMVAGDFFVI